MKLNLARLASIKTTLEAVAQFDDLIEYYSHDLPGPAYLTVKRRDAVDMDIQIDRKLMLELIKTQRDQYIKHLEDRFDGFEYDPDAKWTGDEKAVDQVA